MTERDDRLPVLVPRDLEGRLVELYRRGRKHHLFAFHGTGERGRVELPEHGTVVVVPVRSELELRAELPELDDHEQRVAFLVPWTHDIPVDIGGRFAQGGRVERIGKEARLRRLFGTNAVDPEALRSPLAEHLLRTGTSGSLATGEGLLTIDAMWAAWLEAQWNVPTRGGLALDTLLGFAALDGRGPELRAALQAPEAAGVRAALDEHLRGHLRHAGPLVLRAWEEGRGSEVLELAVLLEVLAEQPDVRFWVREQVRKWVPKADETTASETARTLGHAAAGALRYVERQLGPEHARRIVAAADARVDDAEIVAALAASNRLPSAWLRRLDALGEALRAGAEAPSVEAVAAADMALRALEPHAAATDPQHGHLLNRAQMAVRLLGWLTARTDRRVEPSLTPYGELEALARWYAEEGGFVDWARRAARGASERAFGRGIEAVVKAADAARQDLDRRFAQGLRAWTEAGQPATQVLPIRSAVERVAARFLDGQPDRRLLVLLLDGMAWAQAVQLLEDLDKRGWAPLSWHGTRGNRIGEGPVPAMLAGLPTITDVSRAAFFAGAMPDPGKRLDTQKDPDHWATNRHALRHTPAHDKPRLLLRAEGHTKAGGASPEALSLVADPERRLVAVVINAIDDSLKASHALRVQWATETIASLPELLDHARDHGRAVLLVSDHGHVPSDRLTYRASKTSDGGARWRPWPTPDAPVDDDELALPAKAGQVYARRGDHGVVLLVDDAACYKSGTHAGQHGGASLAEVVAPCVLVGHDDNASGRYGHDAEQQLRRPVVPTWWHAVVRPDRADEGAVEPPAATGRRKPKPPVDERQLGLPTIPVVETPPPAPPPKPAPKAPSSPLAASETLAARAPDPTEREQVVVAVELLLARGGVMSSDAFAAALGLRTFRVGGHVSRFSEILNIDGYEVLRMDHVAKQIHLDRGKLELLFEVKL